MGNPTLNDLQLCPYCKVCALRVIESRKTKYSRRRRKHCDNCGKRQTTHEVSEAFYKDAISNLSILSNVRSLLLKEVTVTKRVTCSECNHWDDGCAFDFPEAGGAFASECSMFKLDS